MNRDHGVAHHPSMEVLSLEPIAIISMHASPVAPLGSGENGGMNVYLRAGCEELSRRGVPTGGFTRQSGGAGTDPGGLPGRGWVAPLPPCPGGGGGQREPVDPLPGFTPTRPHP